LYEQIRIEELTGLLKQAAKAILEIYHQNYNIEYKPDQTPVTLADQTSNNILTSGLQANYPGIPIISEENDLIPYSHRKDWSCFWLVDPLDGTKEFIRKNGEFAINLALIEKTRPVLGMIYIPVTATLYFAVAGRGCFKISDNGEPLSIKAAVKNARDKVIVVGSRSHISSEVYAFIKKLRGEFREVELIRMGSAVKFGLIAEGRADFYLRTGHTMEWDTAAGQAIVMESGKQVYDYKTGNPLYYNKKDLTNPWFLVK
jgi:3'(2'), 5'-bisphosphate nucleotidase